jgi:hypothetical protein
MASSQDSLEISYSHEVKVSFSFCCEKYSCKHSDRKCPRSMNNMQTQSYNYNSVFPPFFPLPPLLDLDLGFFFFSLSPPLPGGKCVFWKEAIGHNQIDTERKKTIWTLPDPTQVRQSPVAPEGILVMFVLSI